MSQLDAMALMRELADAKSTCDIDIFFHEMLGAFGGMRGYAREYAESIKAAEKGSSVQLAALNNLTRALFQFGNVNEEDDDGEDEASLLAEIKRLLGSDTITSKANGDGPKSSGGIA